METTRDQESHTSESTAMTWYNSTSPSEWSEDESEVLYQLDEGALAEIPRRLQDIMREIYQDRAKKLGEMGNGTRVPRPLFHREWWLSTDHRDIWLSRGSDASISHIREQEANYLPESQEDPGTGSVPGLAALARDGALEKPQREARALKRKKPRFYRTTKAISSVSSRLSARVKGSVHRMSKIFPKGFGTKD
ncbi:hypothetical protein ASPZODRAFT_135113 [Penicilliopsis zonata CBS 506.65]|uniref:Uncharacterized protein n=1 Tax=Penicilliopsis zonata CBS 506.65 TaxID=1073090 RepID=A0A1L9SB10_9EURO|nr:hypothetical protein ASPZODRAFT_135113 [Penicilliopsis zonata CBS 506.65]OJJ44307.1 hypothetical protein ASPZODRAFT_135113 [Penicilliopsis zonata CBS 506.65]